MLGCVCGFAQQMVTATLPNGREIRPAGSWIPLAPYPFAISVRPDGEQVAVPSIGFPFALNIVDHPGANPTVKRMPPGSENDPEIEAHAGLAYSPDGSLLYVATGNSGKVRAYRTSDWTQAGELSLDGAIDGKTYSGSFAATLVVSKNGDRIYALDQGNWRVVELAARTLQITASFPTGTYPFGLALSPDESRLYVTNTGLFTYDTIPGTNRADTRHTGLHFPAFGYPSREAREGTVVEGKRVPGLGDENSTNGSSLWTYDISNAARPRLTAKLRLGAKISQAMGAPIGGAAPTGVAADADAVYVTLAHQDAVVRISSDGKSALARADLSPFEGPEFRDAAGRPLRGVMPSGIVVRGGRLYVAESGINAVAVVSTPDLHVITHIPAGWNPSAVELSPDGQTLYVVNAKGKGAGPNGGEKHDPSKATYIGSLEHGSLSVIELRTVTDAAENTRAVIAANTAAAHPRPKLPRLKHCFLVIRENRTFDEVLGDAKGANGDRSLARYGMDGWAAEEKSITHLRVTPNLHALAARYAIGDNFYVDSDVSADGHRWALGIQPTPFFNTAWTSGYGGRRKEDAFAAQPGRRALFGGADAPMPEDEPQFGSLWEHVTAGGLGVLNYGEGLEIEGGDEMDDAAPEGQRVVLNSPVPMPVFTSSDRRFPTFNLGIPDQTRASEFIRDFSRRLRTGRVPGLIVIRLPNDHTAEPRPEDGYPYRASYVADNDLALGRIVAYLSQTSIWKSSALFVTEDDAQGGVDHVDAHRSILLVASPWVRPGAIVHAHTSMGSITRTIDELLGLGPMNLEDALAGEMLDVFDDHPHVEPFAAERADERIFVPGRARNARPKTKEEAAELLDMDNAQQIRKELERDSGELRRPLVRP